MTLATGGRVPRIGASLLLGAAFLWLLLPLVDLHRVTDVLVSARLGDVLLAFGLYAIAYVLRAARLRLAYRRSTASIGGLFRIVSIQNLLGYLLPFRSGELSFVYFLRRRLQIPVVQGAGIWAAVRIVDALACVTILGGAAAILSVRNAGTGMDPHLAGVLILVGLLAAVGLLLLGVVGTRVVRFGWFLRSGNRSGAGWRHRLVDGLAEMMETLAACFDGRNRVLFPVVSISIWLALYGFFAVTLQMSGLGRIDLARVVVGASGAVATHFLPINAPAGVGTLEAGWVLGFGLVGVAPADAMLSGIIMHCWLLVFAGTLGVGSVVFGLLSGERF